MAIHFNKNYYPMFLRYFLNISSLIQVQSNSANIAHDRYPNILTDIKVCFKMAICLNKNFYLMFFRYFLIHLHLNKSKLLENDPPILILFDSLEIYADNLLPCPFNILNNWIHPEQHKLIVPILRLFDLIHVLDLYSMHVCSRFKFGARQVFTILLECIFIDINRKQYKLVCDIYCDCSISGYP